MKKQKEVLIVFKTHLDVGFTDYAANVVERYLNEFIPNAIKVGYELKDTDTPFVWTVGSWLIWQALKNDSDGSVAKAIEDGVLKWHALPFTTHTELMNKELFEYGVSLSKKLDERFGKTTVGAKMSDVPGHTIGMVPILRKNGIKFLHLGVNPASPLPPVPPIFKWRYGDDEITVMYQGDYGKEAEFDDFIVYFAHTGDNMGPQSADVIVKEYEKIREKYPDYILKAATIDDIANRVERLENLPVIEKEIGDTWIHGTGTDPQKVSRYRKLLRRIEGMKEMPCDLSDSLLCVPEHTWGVNLNVYFHYDKYYTHVELEGMKKEREKMENSWKEQRAYVEKAEKLLGVEPDYPVQEPNLDEYEETEFSEDFPYEISWQLFDASDYERYKRDYLRTYEWTWVIWDYLKPGLPDYKGGVYAAKVVKTYKNGEERLFRLEFDETIAKEYGLPCFYMKAVGGQIEIKWFGKKASRLPQAFWFKIKGLKEKWELHKTGVWIASEDVLGSPLICAVDKGVRNGEVGIECIDSALVAPYGRRLLQYGCKDLEQDLYFNLYNNIYNTNFTMWYSDDGLFRFRIDPLGDSDK